MPRHPEPQVLKDWRETVKPQPKVCHNCDFYTQEGLCEKFDQEPPLEFSQTPSACDQWLEAIPF